MLMPSLHRSRIDYLRAQCNSTVIIDAVGHLPVAPMANR
jgi:hypothetical protein